jgi:putative transposase
MARTSRIICPGNPHHVTQQGNRRQDIFIDDEDRTTYLRLLDIYRRREPIKIQGYCLMSNHLHLVVTPGNPEGLTRFLRVVHTCYAQYANAKYAWSGHVFTTRYYSCPMDEEHFWCALRYVEQNPVRAQMVQAPCDWRWSSAPGHCGLTKDPLLDLTPMAQWSPEEWRDWVSLGNPDENQVLRACTYAGRPHGSQAFVQSVEHLLGRTISFRRPGRPSTKR